MSECTCPEGDFRFCHGEIERLNLQLREARKYAAPMDATASVPRLKPCEHSEYWTTHYGNCMACRAADAELQNEALKKLADEMLQNFEGGFLCSIGSIHNTRDVQVGTVTVERWRKTFTDLFAQKQKCDHDGGRKDGCLKCGG